MKNNPMKMTLLALLCTCILLTAGNVSADTSGVRNIVLVHGAWVDGSGWKPVYDSSISVALEIEHLNKNKER